MKKTKHIWNAAPAAEDYPAAHDYLTLLFSETVARKLVQSLRAASTIQRQAKDLLRASQTYLLDRHSPQVAADLKKIDKVKKLSPVLLVRGDAQRGITLTIADGHHRICASWYWDEDEPVACRIVSLPPQQ
jgi:hypothetical protein